MCKYYVYFINFKNYSCIFNTWHVNTIYIYIYLFCNSEMTIDIFPWLLPKKKGWWYGGNFFPIPLNKKIRRAKKIRKQIYFDDVSFDDWQRYKCTTQHPMSTQILMNLSASFSACFYFSVGKDKPLFFPSQNDDSSILRLILQI